MTDEAKLKPCPFCGGRAVVERKGSARQSHIISCEDCCCRLETGEIWNAGRAWNTRPTPPSDRVEAAEAAIINIIEQHMVGNQILLTLGTTSMGNLVRDLAALTAAGPNQEGEPVAWRWREKCWPCDREGDDGDWMAWKHAAVYRGKPSEDRQVQPLYAHPQDTAELVRHIEVLIDNDPDDMVSDCHTVLELWRHEARKLIAKHKKENG